MPLTLWRGINNIILSRTLPRAVLSTSVPYLRALASQQFRAVYTKHGTVRHESRHFAAVPYSELY